MGSLGVLKNTTTICGQLMSQSVEQMMSDMYKAKAQGADVVELRLDCLKTFIFPHDLHLLLNNKPLPVIIVYRPKSEGGEYEGDENTRVEVLRAAKDMGADYIDIELKVAFDLMEEQKFNRRGSSKIIVSCFLDTLTSAKEDLSQLVAHIQSTGADIIKLVSNTSSITELTRMFHLLSHSQVPLIAYSTGERGLISQLLGPKFGGLFVYGSVEGYPVLGLPTLDSLRQAYGVEHIDADTKIFGLISKPVSHSKGPILHNPTFRYAGYNGLYVPMLVDDLNDFFSVYSSPDFAGYSVGIPYKEAVIGCCDEVHPLAQSIGAVNTIVRRSSDGKLIGYNTDCEASITAIEDSIKVLGCVNGEASLPSPITAKQFVVVGAGGAGRALAFGAKTRGARVIIFDIDFDRAKSLAHAVCGEARPYEDLANFQPEKGAILANATPIGMHPSTDRIPVAQVSLSFDLLNSSFLLQEHITSLYFQGTLKDYRLVFDAVYTPRKTTLLRDAENAGALIVSGVEMFLRQAIGQFNLFTGRKAPEDFMRTIVMEKF